MKPKYIFYFHDNKLIYTKKDKIIKVSFSPESMRYGKIIHIEKFIKELKLFIKKEKLNMLISPSILVIIPYNFYNVDKEILLMAFNSVGIYKVEFKSELELYSLKKDTSFLNIHETYLIETIKEEDKIKNYFYPFNLFKNMKQLLHFITSKNKENTYIIFGSNKEIPNYIDLLKKNITKAHYYNNYETYIIEKALKNLANYNIR